MSDFGSPVAQNVNVNPNQALQTLSSIMSLKQQQQQLTAQTAEAQQAQQKNSEMQAVSNLTREAYKSGRYKNDDGSFNNQLFANDVAQVAPTYGQQIASAATSRAGEVYKNQQTLFSLNADRRQQIGSALGALAAQVDPRTGQPSATHNQVIDTIEQLRQQNPKDPDYGRMLTSLAASIDPQASGTQLQQTLRNMAVMANSPDAAQTNPSVGTTQGPTGLQAVQTNPQAVGGVGAVGAPVSQGVGPGAQIIEDAYHNKFVFNPQTKTVTPVGGGGGQSPGNTAAPGFKQPVADQDAVLGSLENTRAIGDIGPTNRNINQHLLQLSTDTKTGPGTSFVQKAAGFLGLPSGSQYQEIGAYLDRQAALAARSMGVPNTNAGLAAAERASGTTEYTPQALQEKVKFADAVNSGAIAYRQGLDKAVGTGATPDLTKYQAFRAAWARNFDPDVYRAEDAMRRGDQQELASIKRRLGKNGMAELTVKSANLRQLENGVVPGG